jgi:hypothetical protein
MIPSFQPDNRDWKRLYEAALSETDLTKLPERIITARSAILDRIEESFIHSLPGEHRVMDVALANLRRLGKLTTSRPA